MTKILSEHNNKVLETQESEAYNKNHKQQDKI